MQSITARVLALALSLSVSSCSEEESWTEAERQNAGYILEAFREAQEATLIENSGQTFEAMSQSDFEQILARITRSYELAQKVADKTLDKVHPGLREHWRDEFSEGLRLRIQNLTERSISAEIRGHVLMDQFGDWWNANKEHIRIPAQGN